jgi:hypothetical protein
MNSVAGRQRPKPGDLVLDHVAHFVPDLGAAGALLERLGFTPSPVSHHQANGKPAGTSNRCLMFEQGYVEILAPMLDTPNAARVRNHMARYPGVHLVCFGSPDAEAEHQRLAAHGFEPEPFVRLQRQVDDGRTVKFNVVYVPPAKMPEARVQYCEHLTPEVIWEPRFVAHPNGVTGLGDAYVVADDPAEAAARWGRFAGLLPSPDGDLVRLDTSRGRIFLGTQHVLSQFIDGVPPPPSVAAFSLAVRDRKLFAERVEKAGLKVTNTSRGSCVRLPEALGGSWLF